MKRWIHSSIDQQAKKINDAERELAACDPEKVEYVKECREAIFDDIANRHWALNDVNVFDKAKTERLKASCKAIKDGYIAEAVDTGMMSEEEFDNIFDLLDIIDLEYSRI